MAHYTWQNNQIESLRIEHGKKYPTAFLSVSADVSPEQHAQWQQDLQKLGLQTTADMVDGRPALRIMGFESDQEILSDLQKTNILTAKPSHVEQDPPSDKKHGIGGLRDWVTKNSMVASGISYLTADSLAFLSGHVRGDINGMRQGAIWASTSVMLVLFGTRDPKQQMQNLYAKMDDYFRSEGVDLSPEQAHMMSELKGNPDFFYNKLKNFIYEHPVEINNSLQGLGGVNLIFAGLNQKKIKFDAANPLHVGHGKPNWFKVAAGISVTFGQWAAMFIDEQPEVGLSPLEKQQRFMDRLEGKEVKEPENIDPFKHPLQWVKQKPLRITGLGASINNMFIQGSALGYERMDIHNYDPTLARNFMPGTKQQTVEGSVKQRMSNAIAAEDARIAGMGMSNERITAMTELNRVKKEFKEFDRGQVLRAKGMIYDQFTPLPNLIANTLYGMSPKDRRGFLKEDGYLEELYAMAANVFVAMPKELQHDRIVKFAGYMANQPDMKSSSKEIEEAVMEKIATLKDNPWLQNSKETAPTQETPDHYAHQIAHIDKGVLSQHSAALAPVGV